MTCVCEWCGQKFTRTGTRGPVPKFCKPAHRQRAYEHRASGGRLHRSHHKAGKE